MSKEAPERVMVKKPSEFGMVKEGGELQKSLGWAVQSMSGWLIGKVETRMDGCGEALLAKVTLYPMGYTPGLSREDGKAHGTECEDFFCSADAAKWFGARLGQPIVMHVGITERDLP